MKDLQTITLIVAFALLLAYLIFDRLVSKKQAAAAVREATAAETRDWQNVKALLAAALPYIITRAENEFCPAKGAGDIKMAAVMDETMKLIPEDMRKAVSFVWLESLIEDQLADLRLLWEKTPVRIADQMAELSDPMLAEVEPQGEAELAAHNVPVQACLMQITPPGHPTFCEYVAGRDSLEAAQNAEERYPGAQILVPSDTDMTDPAAGGDLP